jgi:hypothetical protein
MVFYDIERIKNGFDKGIRKGKDMFTMISKFYLNSELKREALHTYEQGYDVVRSDRIEHYWDLCRKRRE